MKPDEPEVVVVVNSCMVLIHGDEPWIAADPRNPCGHIAPMVLRRNAESDLMYVCEECVADPLHKRINERGAREKKK